jgi:phage-related protein
MARPPAKGERPLDWIVFELVEDHEGDTYRAVYTVRFREVVYVLHAFQKKSPSGIRTARGDVELVERRLKIAQADHEARYGKRKG